MIFTLPNGNTINTRDVRLVEAIQDGPSVVMFWVTVADLPERIQVGTHTWRDGGRVVEGKYVLNGVTKGQVVAAHADLLTKWNAS
jgi:hypothetical protein